jgi:hypothetical protein
MLSENFSTTQGNTFLNQEDVQHVFGDWVKNNYVREGARRRIRAVRLFESVLLPSEPKNNYFWLFSNLNLLERRLREVFEKQKKSPALSYREFNYATTTLSAFLEVDKKNSLLSVLDWFLKKEDKMCRYTLESISALKLLLSALTPSESSKTCDWFLDPANFTPKIFHSRLSMVKQKEMSFIYVSQTFSRCRACIRQFLQAHPMSVKTKGQDTKTLVSSYKQQEGVMHEDNQKEKDLLNWIDKTYAKEGAKKRRRAIKVFFSILSPSEQEKGFQWILDNIHLLRVRLKQQLWASNVTLYNWCDLVRTTLLNKISEESNTIIPKSHKGTLEEILEWCKKNSLGSNRSKRDNIAALKLLVSTLLPWEHQKECSWFLENFNSEIFYDRLIGLNKKHSFSYVNWSLKRCRSCIRKYLESYHWESLKTTKQVVRNSPKPNDTNQSDVKNDGKYKIIMEDLTFTEAVKFLTPYYKKNHSIYVEKCN